MVLHQLLVRVVGLVVNFLAELGDEVQGVLLSKEIFVSYITHSSEPHESWLRVWVRDVDLWGSLLGENVPECMAGRGHHSLLLEA